MRAMVLAAGLGTRLLPLTAKRPKCLMPVGQTPLLGRWLTRLAGLGVERTVVNTHHLAPMVRDFLARQAHPGMEIAESHEPVIRGTGGAMSAARVLLGRDPFLLVNADVVSAADLAGLLRRQVATGAAAVLGMAADPRFNTVALDREGRVRGFQGDGGLGPDLRWLTYTGLAAISPVLVDLLPRGGCLSLVEGLRAALGQGLPVLGWEIDAFWDDLGSPERLWALNRDLALAAPPDGGLEHLSPGAGPVVLGPGAVIEPCAQVEGFCILGEGAVIEANAWVKDSLLFPGARVLSGVRIEEAILGDGFIAGGHISGGAHA